MNAPKILAIIVVIAICAYMLYDTFNSAIPKTIDTPFDIEMDDSGTNLEVDENMNLVLGLPTMYITSHLPQDIKDVTIDVFLGKGDKKMAVGTFDFGVIPANDTATKSFEKEKIPALMFMAYASSLQSDEGKINVPIVMNIQFKYLDWNGTSLLDLGLGISMEGTVSDGNVTIEQSGNTSTVTVDVDDSSSLIASIVDTFVDEFGDHVTATCGDVTLSVEVPSSGTLKVTAAGTTDTAYKMLKDMITDDGLTFTYTDSEGSHDIHLTKEQAETLVKSLETFFPEGS